MAEPLAASPGRSGRRPGHGAGPRRCFRGGLEPGGVGPEIPRRHEMRRLGGGGPRTGLRAGSMSSRYLASTRESCVPRQDLERSVCMAARDGLRWQHGQHQSTAYRALPGNATPALPARPVAGVPGLQAGPPGARRDRELRGTARVLGRGHRDRLDLRPGHTLSRAAHPSPDASRRANRRGARLADRIVRLDGPAAA